MDRGSVAVTVGFVESDSKFGGNVLGTMGRNSERPLWHGRMDLWAEAFIPPPFSSFLYEKPQHLKKRIHEKKPLVAGGAGYSDEVCRRRSARCSVCPKTTRLTLLTPRSISFIFSPSIFRKPRDRTRAPSYFECGFLRGLLS
jgi:hypothetical protein